MQLSYHKNKMQASTRLGCLKILCVLLLALTLPGLSTETNPSGTRCADDRGMHVHMLLYLTSSADSYFHVCLWPASLRSLLAAPNGPQCPPSAQVTYKENPRGRVRCKTAHREWSDVVLAARGPVPASVAKRLGIQELLTLAGGEGGAGRVTGNHFHILSKQELGLARSFNRLVKVGSSTLAARCLVFG